MFLPATKAYGTLEAWMNDKRNVIRFLLARVLLMTVMVLAFSYFYLTQP
ncbi:hypothetical protein [Cyanobium sp. Copco_Reservoir_LC18]|nr:hypothetical protein [Cyanobium sp. Copco_Reservoir_LC18]